MVLVFLLKVSKVGLGTPGCQDFGTLWARILLALVLLCCLHCAFLGGCLVLVFLKVSQVGLGTPVRQDFGTLWARILLGFRWFGCVANGGLGSPALPSFCPSWRLLGIVFLKVSKVGLSTPGRQDFGTLWARILLGFRCFACVAIGGFGSPALPSLRLSWRLLGIVFLKVSKVGLGTPGRQDFGTLWARILLGFRCFACVAIGGFGSPVLLRCLHCALLGGCLVLVFLKVSKVGLGIPRRQDFGTLGARILLGLSGRRGERRRI